jgi:hypothetical protein
LSSNTFLIILGVFSLFGFFYWIVRKTAKSQFLATAPPDVTIPAGSNFSTGDIGLLAEEAHTALVGSWIADLAARERIFRKLLIIPDGELVAVYNYYKGRFYKTDKRTLTAEIDNLSYYAGVWGELNNRNLVLARLRKLKCV